jgi:LacI family transcriptional regulator
LLAGARARALAQGYRIEEINVRDPALSSARLTEILLRRGVRGVIVAPLQSIHEPVVLDWAQFSAVAIG